MGWLLADLEFFLNQEGYTIPFTAARCGLIYEGGISEHVSLTYCYNNYLINGWQKIWEPKSSKIILAWLTDMSASEIFMYL